MSEEIKKILGRLDFNEWEVDLYKVPITWSELYDIRNYITNLQKENNQHISDIQVLMNKKENLERLTKKLQKELDQYKNNWEELKEYILNHYIVGHEIQNTSLDNILNKMKELEEE